MTTVFLDLDGTLTDPGEGIIRSVRHALETLGLEAPPEESLGWLIGPPLLDSFRRLGVRDPQAALVLYRKRYSTVGLFENRLYSGIPEALNALVQAGHSLCLATAKPHVFARRITGHFGLDAFLDHQFGPELDGTNGDKAALLAHALETIGARPGHCVMVGDRVHDFFAAEAVGIRSIAAAWGYGEPAEFRHADAVCASPQAMPECIRRLLA